MATLNRNEFTIEAFPSYGSEATSSIATLSDLGRRQWSSHSEVSSLHSSHSSHPGQDRLVSPPSCHSELPPSYTPPVNNPSTAATDAALDHVVERPVAIPQQRPTATAPFFPAYAPSMRNHGITPPAWRKFVASMNDAILTSAPVTDQARSISRRIRAASGGMWSAIVSSSTALVPNHNNNPSATHDSHDGSCNETSGTGTTERTSPHTSLTGACRTLREERIIAGIAAANIAWFHPQGLHASMMDTTVLARKISGDGSGDARGVLPSRLMEAARPIRDQGPAAQLAGLRPWIAELEVDHDLLPEAVANKTLLELAPDSLWLVVTRWTGQENVAGV
ncbi:hypothetical protein PG984_002960 [Apiospora sp. TS-2023a]